MTNQIVTAVTNLVNQTGGDPVAVANIWIQWASTIGSIIGSLTVIATIDPTNKISSFLGKAVKWFNLLDPNRSQKK